MTKMIPLLAGGRAPALGDASPQIIELSPSAVKPLGREIRVHSKKQITQLVESIRAFGFAVPIIVDEESRVLAGNARVQAAMKAGLSSIPAVRLASLNEQQKRAFAIAENRLSDSARWDKSALKLEFEELQCFDLGFSIDVTGFSFEEVIGSRRQLVGDKVSLTGDLPASISRSDDVWNLGDHYILCSKEQIGSTATGGRLRAKVMFASHQTIQYPPNNGDLDLGTSCASSMIKTLSSGLHREGCLYIESSILQLQDSLVAFAKGRFLVSDVILVPSDQAYSDKIERSPCGFVLGLQVQQLRKSDLSASDSRQSANPGRWAITNTQKDRRAGDDEAENSTASIPIDLRKELALAKTKSGDLIADFLGDGTAVIQMAEDIGRRAACVQEDLIKADRIITQWQSRTGQEAVLAGSNKSFRQVAIERRRTPLLGLAALPPARIRVRKKFKEPSYV